MRPLLLATFLLAASCSRPSVEQCEKLCRDYAELAYWEKSGGRPESEQAEEERNEAWEERQQGDVFLRRLDNCVTDCRQSADRHMVGCVAEAKSIEEADACLEK